jgi:purine nucleosidase
MLKPLAMLIDTDTASDDAVALIMALRSKSARVIAITTVAGNVQVQQATRNALYTAELCGAEHAGLPGSRKAPDPPPGHRGVVPRQDGLGDHGYPPPRRSAEKQHAVEAIIAWSEAIQGCCWSRSALSQISRSHWLRRRIWLAMSDAA